jgi:hypothetical protein
MAGKDKRQPETHYRALGPGLRDIKQYWIAFLSKHMGTLHYGPRWRVLCINQEHCITVCIRVLASEQPDA